MSRNTDTRLRRRADKLAGELGDLVIQLAESRRETKRFLHAAVKEAREAGEYRRMAEELDKQNAWLWDKLMAARRKLANHQRKDG